MYVLKTLLSTVFFALLAGCASTRITSQWHDPAGYGSPLHKIAIFVEGPNPTVNRFAENQAAQSLQSGTIGIAGHQLLKAETPLDIQTHKTQLIQSGFDGVLVSRLISVDKEKVVRPPEYYPDPFFWGPPLRRWPYYGPYAYPWIGPSPFAYAIPSETVDVTHVIIETELYRLPDANLVWRAISDTIDPKSNDDLVKQVVRKLKSALQKRKLIHAEKS